MKTYELTYIISSLLSTEEANKVAKEVEALIQSKEGVILKAENISIQTLSYPIKKQSSGYFAIVEFQTPEHAIKEVRENIEKNHHILRHLLAIKKPVKILKARRIRKPSLEPVAAKVYSEPQERKNQEKLNPEDLEKKLDEILG